MVRYIDIKKAVNDVVFNALHYNPDKGYNYKIVTLYVDYPWEATHIIEAIIKGERNASTLTMTIEIQETKRPRLQECVEKKISVKANTKREIIGKYTKDYDITGYIVPVFDKLTREIKVGKELADGINSVLENNK